MAVFFGPHATGIKGEVTGVSGATATVCLIHQKLIYIASIGDSLAVLCRNGNPISLNVQHRVYGYGEGVPEEILRVEAAGGWIYDGRVCHTLAVSRAFGDLEFKVGRLGVDGRLLLRGTVVSCC